MYTSYNLVQWVVVLIIGVALVFMWKKLCDEMYHYFEINHYILTIMYTISGFIGIKLFSVSISPVKYEGFWTTFLHVMKHAPWDIIPNIIVFIVFFTLFAMFPMIVMLVLTFFYKLLNNPNLLNDMREKDEKRSNNNYF